MDEIEKLRNECHSLLTQALNEAGGHPAAFRTMTRLGATIDILASLATPNPCAKIFMHKWLDPKCVDRGCQSLATSAQPPAPLGELTTTGREGLNRALANAMADRGERIADNMWRERFGVAALTGATRDVLAERARQVNVEGWTPEHDDQHDDGEMARAATVYANPDIWDIFGAGGIGWPWEASWYKPTNRRRDLVKATALLLAEIERLDRAEQKGKP
jgi:hypothetical protein